MAKNFLERILDIVTALIYVLLMAIIVAINSMDEFLERKARRKQKAR